MLNDGAHAEQFNTVTIASVYRHRLADGLVVCLDHGHLEVWYSGDSFARLRVFEVTENTGLRLTTERC